MNTFRKAKWVILVYMLLSNASVQAQTTAYTLSDLVSLSQKHLPGLLSKQALVSMANASVKDAKHAALPSLKLHDEVTISSANSLPGSYFPMGTVVSTSGAIRQAQDMAAASGNIGTVYSEYELYNFGLNAARRDDARASAALSQSEYDLQAYLVKTEMARLYFRALKYQLHAAADKQNMERYHSIFVIIQALAKSGLKAGADSSQALAELAKARITYNQSQTVLMQLKQQIAANAGLAAEQIELDTSIAEHVPLQISEQGIPAANPLIDYYKNQQQLYKSTAKLIRRNYMPRVTLVGALWGRGSSIDYANRYGDLSTGLSYQRFNYAAGIAISYNLFDIVHRSDKLGVNKYKILAAGYALQQKQEDLQTALTQASLQLNNDLDNLKQIELQKQAAQDVFNQKKAQYKAGLANLIDLTNADFVLYRSQIDYIETINDWYYARIEQASATGSIDQFIQSIK